MITDPITAGLDYQSLRPVFQLVEKLSVVDVEGNYVITENPANVSTVLDVVPKLRVGTPIERPFASRVTLLWCFRVASELDENRLTVVKIRRRFVN
mgnify:CR=1 FL=1